MAEELAEEQWYLLIGQERQGPISVHDVRYLVSRKTIDGGTLVWREGLDSLVRLREVEEFHPRKRRRSLKNPKLRKLKIRRNHLLSSQRPSERAYCSD
jgi:hypothetical protein